MNRYEVTLEIKIQVKADEGDLAAKAFAHGVLVGVLRAANAEFEVSPVSAIALPPAVEEIEAVEALVDEMIELGLKTNEC